MINMAQEYVGLRQKNALGQIALSKSVFQTIAKIVIDEDKKIELAENNTPFKYALGCKVQNDQLVITADVKVDYNANVQDACNNLQLKIYENIQHMTDYTPDIIDIRVVGFVF